MLKVPAGSFSRRSPSDNRRLNLPDITVSPFFLSDREVTIDQFQQFIADTEYPAAEKPTNWLGPEKFQNATGEHPVQNVSWLRGCDVL